MKAIEHKLKFEKGDDAPFEYRYVMQADLYNKLSQTKVIQEASLRSGISKGAINAAWDAIGEVIKAWATEGHSVAVPGLGTMRFGLRSTSITDVNKVGTNLITSRRVIFTPSVDIKDELKRIAISITCIDRNGDIVKRVTSTDDADIEDPENDPNDSNGGGSGTNGTSGTSGTGLQSRQYALNISSANTAQGTVNDSVNKFYTEGSRVTITATPKSGYQFDKWSDGNTQASRSLPIDKAYTLVASFKVAEAGGEDTGNTGGGSSDTPTDFM